MRNWAGNHDVPGADGAPPGDASRSCGRSSRARRASARSARATRSPTIARLRRARRARRPAGRRSTSTASRDRDRAAPALRYGELAERADAPKGWRCTTSRSLPHISVAGAIATATHGSGDANGNLATAVAALELVTSERRAASPPARGDPDFDGMVVGLGALGVVTRVTLDVEPAYEVRQRVFEGLRLGRAARALRRDHRRAATASASSRAGARRVDQVWVKSRADASRAGASCSARGRRRSTATRSSGSTPSHCTPQLGVPGPWSDRLPHFRMGFTPERGRGDPVASTSSRASTPVAAIEAVRALGDALRPLLQVAEIRTVAADDAVAEPAVRAATRSASTSPGSASPSRSARCSATLEAALAPFAPRPHWGKLFLAGAADDRRRLRAPARLRGARRAARPARRVPQRLARAPRPGLAPRADAVERIVHPRAHPASVTYCPCGPPLDRGRRRRLRRRRRGRDAAPGRL